MEVSSRLESDECDEGVGRCVELFGSSIGLYVADVASPDKDVVGGEEGEEG